MNWQVFFCGGVVLLLNALNVFTNTSHIGWAAGRASGP